MTNVRWSKVLDAAAEEFRWTETGRDRDRSAKAPVLPAATFVPKKSAPGSNTLRTN